MLVERYRSHWTYPLVKDKLMRFCEEQKVSVIEQSCSYRSQRCFSCGLVRKSQHKGKLYNRSYGYSNDADLNASLNHSIDLPEIDWLRRLNQRLNIQGFYWTIDGVYGLDGKALTVPYTKERHKIIDYV